MDRPHIDLGEDAGVDVGERHVRISTSDAELDRPAIGEVRQACEAERAAEIAAIETIHPARLCARTDAESVCTDRDCPNVFGVSRRFAVDDEGLRGAAGERSSQDDGGSRCWCAVLPVFPARAGADLIEQAARPHAAITKLDALAALGRGVRLVRESKSANASSSLQVVEQIVTD